jgi:hypothetical protein
MPALEDTRLETSTREAGAGVAEAPGDRAGEAIATDPNVSEAEIGREQLLAAADLVPVITQLMDLAGEARDLGTAAGMNAARGLLVEAARLKGLLKTEGVEEARPGHIQTPVMTTEEWMAAFAPNPIRLASQG